MPKTKFQSIVFTASMVFCMVFCMTVYTISMKFGGLSYKVFALAIQEMWVEYGVVYVLRIITPGIDKTIFMILAVQSFTVSLIVPSITLFATFYHNGFTEDWFPQWIQLAAQCFPAALCLQVFFVGPFVRFVFRTIFSIKTSA